MKRSIRRHQQSVAKVRRIRILRCKWRWQDQPIEKPWRNPAYMLMNEPGWHTREFNIRPSRIHSNRFEHLIEIGRDPDTIHWPDYRKPHVYYW